VLTRPPPFQLPRAFGELLRFFQLSVHELESPQAVLTDAPFMGMHRHPRVELSPAFAHSQECQVRGPFCLCDELAAQ
jgi:hypothetical protein